jgi:hypothetical protein
MGHRGSGGEILFRPADDAGERGGRARAIDCMVQDVRPPNRAGGGRDGEAVRARDHRHRLVEAARLLEMRQPR